jgi:hypothetical protein
MGDKAHELGDKADEHGSNAGLWEKTKEKAKDAGAYIADKAKDAKEKLMGSTHTDKATDKQSSSTQKRDEQPAAARS